MAKWNMRHNETVMRDGTNQGYGSSCANPTMWKRALNVNSIPRPQENAYTRFESFPAVNQTEKDFTGVRNTRRENWSDGDGYYEPSPELSNRIVCKEFLELFNYGKSSVKRKYISMAVKLYKEYLLTLEEFNICCDCLSPIKTKKHRYVGALKKANPEFQSEHSLPKGWDTALEKKETKIVKQVKGADYISESGKSLIKSHTVAFRNSEKKLQKRRDEKLSITYRTNKQGTTIETATIEKHYEIKLFLNEIEIPFTNDSFIQYYFDKNAKVSFVEVETKIVNDEKCKCGRHENRTVKI